MPLSGSEGGWPLPRLTTSSLTLSPSLPPLSTCDLPPPTTRPSCASGWRSRACWWRWRMRWSCTVTVWARARRWVYTHIPDHLRNKPMPEQGGGMALAERPDHLPSNQKRCPFFSTTTCHFNYQPQDGGVALAERLERAAQAVKTAFCECPSYDVVRAHGCACFLCVLLLPLLTSTFTHPPNNIAAPQLCSGPFLPHPPHPTLYSNYMKLSLHPASCAAHPRAGGTWALGAGTALPLHALSAHQAHAGQAH